MSVYAPHLAWIDQQRDRMIGLVNQWAEINSGSTHIAGLEKLSGLIVDAFGVLQGDVHLVGLSPWKVIDSSGEVVDTRLADAVRITKRLDASLRVLLCIHIDTVYPPDHPFQACVLSDTNTLIGPGVADAKGGLVVMLVALEALERSGVAEGLGWEVFINPDEEIGSPGSASVLADCAKRNHLGLVFEPALVDGTLAGARGGSGNFTAVVRGRSAHAGRQFHAGRNAIEAAAALVTGLGSLNGIVEDATVNVGRIEGGGPLNMVPDLSICRFNVRVVTESAQQAVKEKIDRIIREVNQRDGITCELHGGWTSPPKPLDALTEVLFDHVAACGRDLGITVRWQSTGGVCDGNRLAAAGLPTVDTLGVRGGDIHSPNEYLLLDSLTERAKLTALLLMKLASGELAWRSSGPSADGA